MPFEKKPSAARILVNDGTGSMVPVDDRRVTQANWPISFVVPSDGAESWMAHLEAEVQEHGWAGGGIAQLEDVCNSGSKSFHAPGSSFPLTVHIIWERPRGGELAISAGPEPTGEREFAAAKEFLDNVRRRHAERRLHRNYSRTILTYSGLPWKGEVWLSDTVRLGPPTKYPETLLGPQCVLVDTLSHGIGLMGAADANRQLVHELTIFLRVVLGISCAFNRLDYGWRCEVDLETGSMASKIGLVGYHELAESANMPSRGTSPPADRREVVRPGLGPYGIHSDMSEQWVPNDIEALWDQFTALSSVLHEQFLRAGNLLLAAAALWPEHRTGYVALHVVACEALKPPGRHYDKWNVYNVIEGLIGAAEANRLRRYVTHPQGVRSKHLHRGELSGGELLSAISNDEFKDPTFDTMMRDLTSVSRVCIIEWLRLGGSFRSYPMSPTPRPTPRSSNATSRRAKQ